MTPDRPPAPHVVMVVSNDVRSDARVRRSAQALAAAGARVTVVGILPEGPRTTTRIGEVTLVRVPVDPVLREVWRERRERHRAGRWGPGVDTRMQEVRRRRLAAAARDLVTRRGLRRRLAGAAVAAARLDLRGRGLLLRRSRRLTGLGWRAWNAGWQRTPWPVMPRRVLPELDDYELALGAVLDELRPDTIHAHDVQLVGVVARACARAAREGRRVPWVYDAHEWVTGLSRYGGRTRRVVAAWAALEARYVHDAARVITVSPQLADALRRRYRLARTPDVVLNVPSPGEGTGPETTVRSAAGVPEGVPLLVYSGGVQAARGVRTAVAALARLPQAHLAVVAVPSVNTPAVAALKEQAVTLGVADRVHVLPGVAPDEVIAFLRDADVGLIPLLHYGSHEMALPNKLFEYLHAGLPAVVSDCRAQAEFVHRHGTGVVHRADDPADLASAVLRVRADPGVYAAAVRDPELRRRYTWQAQAEVLQAVYRDLVPGLAPGPVPVPAAEPVERPTPPRPPGSQVTLAIGPANSAGQAWAWTRAAARHLKGVHPYVVAVRNGRYDYPADELVDPAVHRWDVDWQLRLSERAVSRWTHVLLEAGRPLTGGLRGPDFTGDARVLRAAGLAVGLVVHGSEARNPRRHRGTHEFSPFARAAEPLTRTLQERFDRLAPLLAADPGPLFVSTPDQLDDLPGGCWLPVVVDLEQWSPAEAPLMRPVPVVVHAPTNPALKGTAEVERVLRPLADRGVLELRMLTGLPPAEAAAQIRRADVVVDQVLLGLYGVLACEAMACGRLVLGHLGEPLRSRVGQPVPVVEADPRTLAQVMEWVLDDRAAAREHAATGRAFVEEVHDGRLSAAVLAPFLGRAAPMEVARVPPSRKQTKGVPGS